MTGPALSPRDGRRDPNRRQTRRVCDVCGRWLRVDHRCPMESAAKRSKRRQQARERALRRLGRRYPGELERLIAAEMAKEGA